jgi:hypothetical protein
VYLKLLPPGLDGDGIDGSAGVPEHLRERAARRGLDPSVREADVTTVDTDRGYDGVYAPARAVNRLHTLGARRAAFHRVHETLAEQRWLESFESLNTREEVRETAARLG